MARRGTPYAQFFSATDLNTPLTISGVSAAVPVSVSSQLEKSTPGRASVTFPNSTITWQLAAPGNRCIVYQYDSLRPDLLGGPFVAFPFTIKERRPGRDTFTVTGDDLLARLDDFVIYRPLGAEVITSTTLAEQTPQPAARVLPEAVPQGNKTITMSATNSADIGQEVRITLNSGAVHVTRLVERVFYSGAWRYTLKDGMPGPASAGNAVVVRPVRIKPTSPTTFEEGVEALVTLNGGAVHTTLVEKKDGEYIILKHGLPAQANAGNLLRSRAYTGKSTSDVTDVMAYAQGWSVAFETGTGTLNGTRYPGGGESVLSILRSIAQETGEFFRLDVSNGLPNRRIQWRRTADTAGYGGTLRLVMPTQSSRDSDAANVNRGIILSEPGVTYEHDVITDVIPVAGSAKVTLFSCSSSAVAAAQSQGFSVVTTGLGLYAPPYVRNQNIYASVGIRQRRATFSEVDVDSDSPQAISAAADRLLNLAIAYLNEHKTATVEIVIDVDTAVQVLPGQRVELVYTSPTGETTLNYTGSNSLHVNSVRRSLSPDGDYPGVPVTTLTLSNVADTQTRGGGSKMGAAVGRQLAAVDRLVAKGGTPESVAISVTQQGGQAGLDPAVYYAHAANASAHHAPVSAGEAINVSGQQISLKRPANSGLLVDSSGVRVSPATLTRDGTNSVSGTAHTHAVQTTTNAKDYPGRIMSTTDAGAMRVTQLQATQVDTSTIIGPGGAVYVTGKLFVTETITAKERLSFDMPFQQPNQNVTMVVVGGVPRMRTRSAWSVADLPEGGGLPQPDPGPQEQPPWDIVEPDPPPPLPQYILPSGLVVDILLSVATLGTGSVTMHAGGLTTVARVGFSKRELRPNGLATTVVLGEAELV